MIHRRRYNPNPLRFLYPVSISPLPHHSHHASMEDFTEDAFANRGSPVPVIGFGDGNSPDGADESDNGAPRERKPGLFKKHASNLKDTFKRGHKRTDSGRSFNVQDRLLER